MTGTIKRVTTNFSLAIPYFNAPNWGQSFERNMDIIDAVLSTAGGVSNIVGPWANNTVFGVDDRVVDEDDNSVWQAAVAHTSAVSGTFAADRAANPTYWDAVSQSVVVRGAFVHGADYFVGDFVYDESEYLGGIVLAPFTGDTNLRNDVANIGIIYDLKTEITDINTAVTNAQTAETNAETAETNAETAQAAAEQALADIAATFGVTSINALADVDTATDVPTTGDGLVWDGANWVPGPAGGGKFKGDNGTVGSRSGDIFRINNAILTVDTTIDADENASCTGPLEIDTGVTLTVTGNLVIL